MQAELSLRRATEPASRCEELHWWGAGGPLLSVCASGTPSNQDVRAFLPQRQADYLGRGKATELPSHRLGSWMGTSVVELFCSLLFFFPRHLEAPSLTITLFEGAWLGRQALLLWGPKPQGPEAIFSGTTLFPWTAKLVLATSGRGGVLVSMELP